MIAIYSTHSYDRFATGTLNATPAGAITSTRLPSILYRVDIPDVSDCGIFCLTNMKGILACCSDYAVNLSCFILLASEHGYRGSVFREALTFASTCVRLYYANRSNPQQACGAGPVRRSRVPAKTRNSMGPRIRELRIERGMTLDELARAANISASHLSRLERGQTAPSFKVAADIARHIGVKPSELATIQREQSDVDQALIEALTARGLNDEIAQHICDKISTVARAALLEVVR